MNRLVLALLLLSAAEGAARAGEPAGTTLQREGAIEIARREFITATEHVKDARWGEALAAFERSSSLRPHALTTYNIGACERALGRYTRARGALRRALVENEKSGNKELPASFADEATTWLTEIQRLLVTITLSLENDADLLVDGQPLVREGTEASSLVGGIRGEVVLRPAPGARATLDPGAHLFSITKKGFSAAVVSRTFAPGESTTLLLELKRLPATIRVSSNREWAAVSIGGVDVGMAPVEISRPAGKHRVVVRKPGYLEYDAMVTVNPGEEVNLRASLVAEPRPIYGSFWFWAAAGVVVAGATAGTYFATRPPLERPGPDGGGLGYVVHVP